MAIRLIRAGSHGEYEQEFIHDKRIHVTWDGLDVDLAKLRRRSAIEAERLPLKSQPAIQIGEITGDYQYAYTSVVNMIRRWLTLCACTAKVFQLSIRRVSIRQTILRCHRRTTRTVDLSGSARGARNEARLKRRHAISLLP